MTAQHLLDQATADNRVNFREMTILLQVNAKAFADAARQRKDGSLKASHLTMPLLGHGTFVAIRYTNQQIILRNLSTGHQYSALMPPKMAEHLEAFQRGRPELDDHEFELILVSDE